MAWIIKDSLAKEAEFFGEEYLLDSDLNSANKEQALTTYLEALLHTESTVNISGDEKISDGALTEKVVQSPVKKTASKANKKKTNHKK